MKTAMKKVPRQHSLPASPSGFTLIELAIGIALVGIILSGALLIGGKAWEAERGETNRDYLNETKSALLDYARQHGRLPMMDSAAVPGVGSENPIADADNYNDYIFGWVPYLDIGTKERDVFGSQVQYFVNWQLAKGGDRPCAALKNLLKGKFETFNASWWFYYEQEKWTNPPIAPKTCWFPLVDVKNMRIPAAAVLISPGPDRTFNFPNNAAYTFRYFDETVPTSIFDDMVVHITVSEAYAALNCQ